MPLLKTTLTFVRKRNDGCGVELHTVTIAFTFSFVFGVYMFLYTKR